MTREELFQMVELLRDTAKLHQPNEEILTDVKAESFVFVMESVLSALSENKGEWKRTYLDHVAMGERPSILYCSVCHQCIAYPTNYCPNCGADMRKTETCNGCTHPCIMYEPTMKACEKKGR